MLSFFSGEHAPFDYQRRLRHPIPPDVGHDSVPSGARFRKAGHDSVTDEKVPHFPTESCPTSERNAAPLQTESVPHFDRNPQSDGSLIQTCVMVWTICSIKGEPSNEESVSN